MRMVAVFDHTVEKVNQMGENIGIKYSQAEQNFILCAAAEGLGTCWIGAFDEEKVKETLSICQTPIL